MTIVRRFSALLMAAAVAFGGVSLAAAPVEAASKTATRVVKFTAPTSVYKSQSFTLRGTAQRKAGTKWAVYAKPKVEIYFDPAGSAQAYKVKTVTGSTKGQFSAKVRTYRSGLWWAKVTVTGKYKAADSYKKLVRVKQRTSMVPSGTTCPSWAPIKGNESSHIYHVPGGAFYNRTNPEICFSTPAAARNAGYRASKV
jgi:hypothetical protein